MRSLTFLSQYICVRHTSEEACGQVGDSVASTVHGKGRLVQNAKNLKQCYHVMRYT